MERFLKRTLVGIGVASVIIWGAIALWGEEPPAKSPEQVRRERFERCRNILWELFPAELRSDYNCLGLLADEGLLSEATTKFLDESALRYRDVQMLWIRGGRLNEDLFGFHPREGAKESELDAAMKELHELGTRCTVDVKILRGKMPLADLMRTGAGTGTVSEPAPETEHDCKLVEEALTNTLTNQLALLYAKKPKLFDREWTYKLKMACDNTVNFYRLSVRLMRRATGSKNRERLMELETKILQDERELDKFLMRLPTARRWKEVWEK